MKVTVLLDSSAWLEYFFGSDKTKDIKSLIEEAKDFIVCTKVNIFEIYHKILKERGKEDAERFTSFILLKSLLDEFDTETIKLAAEEKIKLKLGVADAVILSTAIKYNATIYTTDSDFKKAKNIVKIVFLK